MKEIIDQIIEIDTLAFENKTKNEQVLINKKQEYEDTISGYRDKMLLAAKNKAQSIAEETEAFSMENEKSLQERIQKTSAQLDKDFLKAEKELVQKIFNKLFVLEG
ncbi:MAG: hypothetical protein AB7V48_03930 [Sedimentibacter sp.]